MTPRTNVAAFAALADQQDRLKRMMSRAHAVSSRTGDELAVKWAKNIAYYLYARCREFSPTAEMFGTGASSIALAHNWKIADLKNNQKISSSQFSDKGKSRKQFSRVADIMRQRGRHRLFIASGWLAVRKIVNKNSTRLETQAKRNGAVIVEHSFGKVKVRIINTSTYAKPFHDKHNIVALALSDETEDLAQYVARKTHEDVKEILRTT